MSWDNDDHEYANGADGSCHSCGGETAEEWHAFCGDCYREEMGWSPPARPEPGTQPESFVVGLASLREVVRQQSEVVQRQSELVLELSERIDRLERKSVAA